MLEHTTPHSHPEVHHVALATNFVGIRHPSSTPEAVIHQYRGIKYASVPARFRAAKLVTACPALTDATNYGPICPQVHSKRSFEEELFGLPEDVLPPHRTFTHNEFECLNLNITCPAGLNTHSRLPVMLWVHGGGERGSGSSWVYDGAAFVRKSMLSQKPVIVVSFNYRIGLFGSAASPMIAEDNRAAGDAGAGNYGLRDQRKAMEWIHHYIAGFGGDPTNVTLFGASSGAADILYHLLSDENETKPLFHRAIVQSAIIDYNLPDVSAAGYQLSRLMSALRISTVDALRAVDAEALARVGHVPRVVDDGVFLRNGWRDCLSPEGAHQHHHRLDNELRVPTPVHGHGYHSPHDGSRSRHLSRTSSPAGLPPNLQPLIIGDCSADAALWAHPVSLWTAPAAVRRLKAVCLSLARANGLLCAYDLSSYTPADELAERLIEMTGDARIAWPTECAAQGAKRLRGGKGVWRYVFDQEGAARGIPHHAADLMYLFDNVPLPAPPQETFTESFCDGPFDVDDEDEVGSGSGSTGSFHEDLTDSGTWDIPPVDAWAYSRVRDAMQERWIAFAHGEAPWAEDKTFVFGPEGETGERVSSVLEGRRRQAVWKKAFEPLGMQLVQKVGLELSRGPPHSSRF
ncbi:hypothetical protein HGRIS_000236 [Hohenbuehelia grisea]|uniref:Carboxylic ester hydrolase n=1 Tax=Hohenbuehelia grisea TaxID=104357 RepID=A0ABR3JS06_9AGAR